MAKTPSDLKKPAATKTAAKKPTARTVSATKPARASAISAPAKKATPAATTAKAAPKTTKAPEKSLSKKELIERVIAKSDLKKGEVRRVLDATMSVFREALVEGYDISAAPLGKVKIARSRETPNGKLVICRVKLKTDEAGADTKATTATTK